MLNIKSHAQSCIRRNMVFHPTRNPWLEIIILVINRTQGMSSHPFSHHRILEFKAQLTAKPPWGTGYTSCWHTSCQTTRAVSRQEQRSQVCIRTTESAIAQRSSLPPDSPESPRDTLSPKLHPQVWRLIYTVQSMLTYLNVQNKKVYRQVWIACFCFWRQQESGFFTSLLILDKFPWANIGLCGQYRAGQASLLHI